MLHVTAGPMELVWFVLLMVQIHKMVQKYVYNFIDIKDFRTSE